MMDETVPPATSWLLLVHQLPPKPAYLRVKIWRRLQALGAVSVKNSVYVLPSTERTAEDLRWVRREIEDGGGEAAVCEARFVDGLRDDEVRALFGAARDPEYQDIAAEARVLLDRLDEGAADDVAAHLRRLRKRFAQVAALDFFGAPSREVADGLLTGLAERLAPPPTSTADSRDPRADYRRRVWVTREGVGVDRIASAWLITRFIDPEATFRFVASSGYAPVPGDVRFDMFEAEFTHVGDHCTFEVLVDRMGLAEPALGRIAEIVHDIDLKDAKFQREETPGVALVLDAIGAAHPSDEDRIARGGAVLDDLHRMFAAKGR